MSQLIFEPPSLGCILGRAVRPLPQEGYLIFLEVGKVAPEARAALIFLTTRGLATLGKVRQCARRLRLEFSYFFDSEADFAKKVGDQLVKERLWHIAVRIGADRRAGSEVVDVSLLVVRRILSSAGATHQAAIGEELLVNVVNGHTSAFLYLLYLLEELPGDERRMGTWQQLVTMLQLAAIEGIGEDIFDGLLRERPADRRIKVVLSGQNFG